MSNMKQWYEEKNSPAPGTPLLSMDDISIGQVKEIEFGESIKTKFKMFLYRTESDVLAYLNRCPHFNVPLNVNAGELFCADGSEFQCCHHYARFDKITGVCTDGPCEGRVLTKIPIELAGDSIVVGAIDQ